MVSDIATMPDSSVVIKPYRFGDLLHKMRAATAQQRANALGKIEETVG